MSSLIKSTIMKFKSFSQKHVDHEASELLNEAADLIADLEKENLRLSALVKYNSQFPYRSVL